MPSSASPLLPPPLPLPSTTLFRSGLQLGQRHREPLLEHPRQVLRREGHALQKPGLALEEAAIAIGAHGLHDPHEDVSAVELQEAIPDRKSTRLNSSHLVISYAVFCFPPASSTSAPSLHDALPIWPPARATPPGAPARAPPPGSAPRRARSAETGACARRSRDSHRRPWLA